MSVAFQDAAIFLRDHEALFVEKISTVVIAGGIHKKTSGKYLRHKHTLLFSESPKASSSDNETSAEFAPDISEWKIQSDIVAAQYFYARCQKLGIPLVIVPEEVSASKKQNNDARSREISKTMRTSSHDRPDVPMRTQNRNHAYSQCTRQALGRHAASREVPLRGRGSCFW